MNRESVNRARTLAAAATPGEWHVEGEGNPDMATGKRRWPRVFGGDGQRLWNPYCTDADAEFIAAARTGWPDTLDALGSLIEIVEGLMTGDSSYFRHAEAWLDAFRTPTEELT